MRYPNQKQACVHSVVYGGTIRQSYPASHLLRFAAAAKPAAKPAAAFAAAAAFCAAGGAAAGVKSRRLQLAKRGGAVRRCDRRRWQRRWCCRYEYTEPSTSLRPGHGALCQLTMHDMLMSDLVQSATCFGFTPNLAHLAGVRPPCHPGRAAGRAAAPSSSSAGCPGPQSWPATNKPHPHD